MSKRNRVFSRDDIIEDMKRLVIRHGTQAQAAAVIGIKLQYFNDVLHGRREPGPKILKGLNYKKGYARS